MMDFGMPTLLETRDLQACIALCRELGLSFIELNMNLPQYQVQSMEAGLLSGLAQKSGVYFTIHLEENLDVCNFNPLVCEAYRETVFQTIELAKVSGIPILNMHLSSGVHFTLPDRKVFLFEEYRERYLDRLRHFRDECDKRLAGSGCMFCIENSGGYAQGFLREGLALLLQSDVFGLTFDIGHNHSAGGGDEAVILQYGDKLCHMHLHDAIGGKNHLLLGTGELKLDAYLKLAQEHGCRAVIETKTVDGLRQSVRYLRNLH